MEPTKLNREDADLKKEALFANNTKIKKYTHKKGRPVGRPFYLISNHLMLFCELQF
jgi:hypothetical protein